MPRYDLYMSNTIQIIENPNQHIMTQVYNKQEKRISEIMEFDGKYVCEYFIFGSGGTYHKQMRTFWTQTYACAFLAAKAFAENGEQKVSNLGDL